MYNSNRHKAARRRFFEETEKTMSEANEQEVLISARNLVKTYHGRRVVSDVSITVKAGEVVGLLGPNGAGKTTSFYMVMGLIRPDSGEITFRDVDITHMPMYKRARMGMGYLAQEPSIFRKLTVEENIMAILETLAISAAERRQRCKELLDELELTRLARQKAMTLSGGDHPGAGHESVVHHAGRTVQRRGPAGGVRCAADHPAAEAAQSGDPDYRPQRA